MDQNEPERLITEIEDGEEVYVGFPTEILSTLVTNISRVEGGLGPDKKLEVQAVGVQGEVTVSLVKMTTSKRILN